MTTFAPFTITWEEEDGREMEVRDWCRRCYKKAPKPNDVWLVSPRGMAHHSKHDGTACGIPATGPDWWWRS